MIPETNLEATDVLKAVCDSLVKVLKEGVDVQRCAAAKALGSLKHPDSVEPLIEALLDEDPDVRADVAEALSRIKDSRALHQLLENFIGDPDTDVKRYALRALVDMRHAPIEEWLVKLLREEDDEIQWDEVDFVNRGWDDREDFRLLAIEGLGSIKGIDAVKDIAAVLDDEFAQDMSETCFRSLVALGDDGIAVVGKHLAQGSERQRRRAASALAASTAPAAEQFTNKALQDKALDVRIAAARVLANRDACDSRLHLLLADSNPVARAEGIRLCGANNSEWILRLIDDKDTAVQIAALEVLAQNPTVNTGKEMIAAVREHIVGKKDKPSPASVVAVALKAYVAIGAKDSLELLTQAAQETAQGEDVRLAAIDGLSVLGDETAVSVLTQLVADDTRQVRLNAMAGLASVVKHAGSGEKNAVQALFAALHGELLSETQEQPEEQQDEAAETHDGASDEEVQAAAGDENELEEETALLQDDSTDGKVVDDDIADDDIELAASDEVDDQDAPIDMGPTSTLAAVIAVNEQVEVFKDGAEVELTAEDIEMLEKVEVGTGRKKGGYGAPQPYDDVRRFAARMMGDLSRADVAIELAGILRSSDQNLAVTAADSIALIADGGTALPYEVVQALIYAFQTGERDLRMHALRGLANDVGGKGPGLLADGLKDPDPFVRIEALRGFGNRKCAGQEAVDMLVDDYPDVRLAAARAIAQTATPTALGTLAKYAFAFEALHRRQSAGLMKTLDANAASTLMIDIIEDEAAKRQWQAAVEVLDTLHNSDVGASV